LIVHQRSPHFRSSTGILTSAVLMIAINSQLPPIGYTVSIKYALHVFFGLCPDVDGNRIAAGAAAAGRQRPGRGMDRRHGACALRAHGFRHGRRISSAVRAHLILTGHGSRGIGVSERRRGRLPGLECWTLF
jgi:hypothetical protein